MYLEFSFFLWVYIISCLLVIAGTYIAFKLDDTVEHTLYGAFDEEMYGFFFILAFVPLANTTIAFISIINGILLLYYCLIHDRLVKICKRIKL